MGHALLILYIIGATLPNNIQRWGYTCKNSQWLDSAVSEPTDYRVHGYHTVDHVELILDVMGTTLPNDIQL